MTHVHNATCERLQELIPAYSLGATDADETEFVKAHLADCPQAVAELAEYSRLAEGLLFSTPAVQPPPHLKDRLRVALASSQPAVLRRQAELRTTPRSGLWQRLGNLFRIPRWQLAWATTAIAVLLLLANTLYWSGQLGEIRRKQQELVNRVAMQSAVLALVGEGNAWRVTLPAGPWDEEGEAYATVICNPERTIGFVYAENLPPLPEDKAYQLWLLRGEERISGGLFRPNPDGSGVLIFQAPEPLGYYDSIGITPEPATGSPGPTAPPVIKGTLYGGGTYF